MSTNDKILNELLDKAKDITIDEFEFDKILNEEKQILCDIKNILQRESGLKPSNNCTISKTESSTLKKLLPQIKNITKHAKTHSKHAKTHSKHSKAHSKHAKTHSKHSKTHSKHSKAHSKHAKTLKTTSHPKINLKHNNIILAKTTPPFRNFIVLRKKIKKHHKNHKK